MIKNKIIEGEPYYSTMDLFKFIGLSSHQAFKKKAEKLNISLLPGERYDSWISKPSLETVLNKFLYTLKESQIGKVKELLSLFNLHHTEAEMSSKVIQNQTISSEEIPLQKDKQGHPEIPKVIHTRSNEDSLNETGKSGFDSDSNNFGHPGIQQENQNSEVDEVKPKLKLDFQSTWVDNLVYKFEAWINPISGLLEKKPFIFTIAFISITIQAVHFAHLEYHINPDSNYLLAITFGLVFEITALILTINKGKQAYIIWFALIAFLVNLFYYEIWMGEIQQVVVKVIISGALAYAIFAYSHLYSMKKV